MTAKDVHPEETSATERRPFQTLLATSPPRGRGGIAAALASVVFHVAIAFLLVIVTLSVKEAAEDEDPEEVTFIKIEEAPPPPPPPPPPEPVQMQPQVVPPKGFQTLTTPVDIPDEIPPPDTVATSELDFSGEGVEGGIAAGVEGAPPVEDVTYMMSQVSVLPKMTKIVKPDYPSMLKRQEIAGQVMLQVVVLPSGEIDRSTLKVVKSLHPQLDEAAKRALNQSKFSPAFYGGRPVRVVLLVPYVFSFK